MVFFSISIFFFRKRLSRYQKKKKSHKFINKMKVGMEKQGWKVIMDKIHLFCGNIEMNPLPLERRKNKEEYKESPGIIWWFEVEMSWFMVELVNIVNWKLGKSWIATYQPATTGHKHINTQTYKHIPKNVQKKSVRRAWANIYIAKWPNLVSEKWNMNGWRKRGKEGSGGWPGRGCSGPQDSCDECVSQPEILFIVVVPQQNANKTTTKSIAFLFLCAYLKCTRMMMHLWKEEKQKEKDQRPKYRRPETGH